MTAIARAIGKLRRRVKETATPVDAPIRVRESLRVAITVRTDVHKHWTRKRKRDGVDGEEDSDSNAFLGFRGIVFTI